MDIIVEIELGYLFKIPKLFYTARFTFQHVEHRRRKSSALLIKALMLRLTQRLASFLREGESSTSLFERAKTNVQNERKSM